MHLLPSQQPAATAAQLFHAVRTGGRARLKTVPPPSLTLLQGGSGPGCSAKPCRALQSRGALLANAQGAPPT